MVTLISLLLGSNSFFAQNELGLAGGSEFHKEDWFVNKDLFSKKIDLPPTIQKVEPIKILSSKVIENIGLYEALSGETDNKENIAPPERIAENKFDALANLQNMPIAIPSLIPEMPTLNPMDSTVHYFILQKMVKPK